MNTSTTGSERKSGIAGCSIGTYLGLSTVSGMLLMGLAFALSILAYRGAQYMGVSDSNLEGRIADAFRDTIVLTQLQILELHFVFGIILGLGVGLLLVFTMNVFRFRLRWSRFLLLAVPIQLLLHLVALFDAMVGRPQMFTDFFNYGGSFGAGLMDLVCSFWSVWAMDFLITAAGLYLAFGAALMLHRRVMPGRFMWARVLSPFYLLAAGSAAAIPLQSHLTNPDLVPVKAAQPNIIILAVDSLRPDYLEDARGGGFARILSRSVVFDRAYTSFPRTFPSWVTYLTGKQPYHHGIRHMFPTPGEVGAVGPTVVHRFQQAGYRTGVFSDFAGDIFRRLDFGFQKVDAPTFSLDANVRLSNWKLHVNLLPWLQLFHLRDLIPNVGAWERGPDARLLTDKALDWLGEGNRPFFLTIFYSTPHYPFSSPYPYYQRYSAQDYQGPNRYLKAGMDDGALALEEVEQIRGLYKGAIDDVDTQISRLLDTLEAHGMLDNTVVILISDHGENLYEFGNGMGHGDHLYGTASIQVPLAIMLPGAKRTDVKTPVRGIDLAPTLAGLAGITLEGADGVPLLTGKVHGETPVEVASDIGDLPVYAETGLVYGEYGTDKLDGKAFRFQKAQYLFQVTAMTWELYLSPEYHQDFLASKSRMYLRGSHKLLYIPTRRAPLWELYDLEKDPEEKYNLFSEDDPLSRTLRNELLEALGEAGDVHQSAGYLLPTR